MDLFENIDKNWTLFLDRDGVINHEKDLNYILNRGEFRFYDGVPAALQYLANAFGKLIVVTNQRGIGKQLMTDENLLDIHNYMQGEIVLAGGRIDKIYYCSSMDNDCYERKPNPGMAHLAKTDFPQIDFTKSIIAGNRLSDMAFGRNAGMYTVFVATTDPETPFPHPLIDFRFNDLPAFANHLRRLRES